MTHEEFLAKIQKGLGPSPVLAARDRLAALIREKGLRIQLRWEWIKDRRLLEWAFDNEEIDFLDGEEWIEIFAYEDDDGSASATA